MKSEFSGYYSISEEELKNLWKECVFIVDTNVLLNLYRYQREASDELLKVLKKLSTRLWIPFQVGLEYQENRLNVINEQVDMYHRVVEVLDKTKENLEQEIYGLKLQKRHSFIDPSAFLKKVDTIFDEFQLELEKLQKSQPSIYDYDHLRDEVDSIFSGKIGGAPHTQEELDEIYEEGEIRYSKKYPPGYMDVDKEKDLIKRKEKTAYLFGGLSFQRKYGDLILWNEIIQEAKANEKLKKIIFVSGDVKEDWWYRVDRYGTREKALIGPRPELIQEIKEKAGVDLFYMYQTEDFVLDANKYFGTQVSQDVVEQIRDVNSLQKNEQSDAGVLHFLFRINKSFKNYKHHPITIPRAQNELVELNKFDGEDVLILSPYGSAKGFIYSGESGWGDYYQISARALPANLEDPLSNFEISQEVKVEIERVNDVVQVSVSFL